MNWAAWVCLTPPLFPKTSRKPAVLAITFPFCYHSPCRESQSPGGRKTSVGKPLPPNTNHPWHIRASYSVSLKDHARRACLTWIIPSRGPQANKPIRVQHAYTFLLLCDPVFRVIVFESHSLDIRNQHHFFSALWLSVSQESMELQVPCLRYWNTTYYILPSDLAKLSWGSNPIWHAKGFAKFIITPPHAGKWNVRETCALTHLIQINLEIWFIFSMPI